MQMESLERWRLLALYLSWYKTIGWFGLAWTQCSWQVFAWTCTVSLKYLMLWNAAVLQLCCSSALVALSACLLVLLLVCIAQHLMVAELCLMSFYACCLCAGCEMPSCMLACILRLLVTNSPVVTIPLPLTRFCHWVFTEPSFLALQDWVILSFFQLNLWLNPSQQRGGVRRMLANQEGRKTKGKTKRKGLPVKWNTKTFASMANAYT